MKKVYFTGHHDCVLVQKNSQKIHYFPKCIENRGGRTLTLTFAMKTLYSSIGCGSQCRTEQRKRKKMNNGEQDSDVAPLQRLYCGTKDGNVIVWSLENGNLEKIIQSTQQNPVVGVDYIADSNALVVAIEPNYVTTITGAERKGIKSKFDKPLQIPKKFGHVVCLAASSGYIAVGTESKILIFDSVSKEIMKQLDGHPNGPFMMKIFQNQYLVSSDQHERFVNVYNLKSSENFPISVQCPNPASDFDFKDNWLLILSNTEDVVQVTKIEDGSAKAHCTVNGGNEKIMGASFDALAGHIIVATGTEISPFFLRLDVRKSKVHQIMIPEQARVLTKGDKIQTTQSVVTPANMMLPDARLKLLGNKKSGKSLGKTIEDDKYEEWLKSQQSSEKLPQFQVATTLSQALQGNDTRSIYEVLNVENISLINSTVKNLPPSLCLDLIQHIIERYKDNQKSQRSLVLWLSSIFRHHSIAISQSHQIVEKLSPLYHSLKYRTSSLNHLIDLSGRLDLLLGAAGYEQTKLSTDLDAVEEDQNLLDEDNEGVDVTIAERRTEIHNMLEDVLQGSSGDEFETSDIDMEDEEFDL